MKAVLSVPISEVGRIGYVVGQGRPLATKEVPEVGRAYLLTPLFTLAGLGLFDQPDLDIQYFHLRSEAMAWAERDIRLRRLRGNLSKVARRVRVLREERGLP